MYEVYVDERYAKLRKTTIQNSNKDELSRMFFTTECIKRKGSLNLKFILYRIASIINLTLNYKYFKLNYDHVSTWILTGRVEWTTYTLLSRRERVDHVMWQSYKGEVRQEDLEAIEANRR